MWFVGVDGGVGFIVLDNEAKTASAGACAIAAAFCALDLITPGSLTFLWAICPLPRNPCISQFIHCCIYLSIQLGNA